MKFFAEFLERVLKPACTDNSEIFIKSDIQTDFSSYFKISVKFRKEFENGCRSDNSDNFLPL